MFKTNTLQKKWYSNCSLVAQDQLKCEKLLLSVEQKIWCSMTIDPFSLQNSHNTTLFWSYEAKCMKVRCEYFDICCISYTEKPTKHIDKIDECLATFYWKFCWYKMSQKLFYFSLKSKGFIPILKVSAIEYLQV
jgi:hypothetical protein